MRTSPYYAMLLTASLLPSIGMAQDELSMDPNLNPSLGRQPRVVYGSPPGTTPADPSGSNLAWGTQLGATWIAASQFTVRLSATAQPALTYAGNHFYTNTGASGAERFYAHLDVEPGVLVSHLTCVYNDNSESDNIRFEWHKYETDLNTGSTTSTVLESFVTSGTPGVDYDFLNPPDETMSTYAESNGLVNHYVVADLTPGTSFAGCWAFWHRQVAPAPAVASFADVPTGHPQFQFIEALVDAGITSGCDGSNYCPGAPLTRGQMAVFLAKAFGLGFQH